MSMISLELRFPYGDVKTARAVLSAVGPENRGFIETKLEGSTVVYNIEADSAGSLRNTADDLLACIKAAEESAGLVSEPYREPEERPERPDITGAATCRRRSLS